MKTTLTSQALRSTLIKHLPQPWNRAAMMHLAIAERFDAEQGLSACTQEELAADLKITTRSVRNLKKQVAESGFWILTRGSNGQPSTYTPSKRLLSLVRRDAR